MQHRRDIEGLRAIAVVVVLLYHFGVAGFGGGFVGVDVFFVISGFLITSLLINERASTGRISIGRFYARRARRLLPISTTVIAATALAGAIWLPATRLDSLAEDVRASALFAANALFANRGTDYLTADLVSPLQHYWSLAVEEQFYLLWPGLIALVTLRARNVSGRTAAAMGAFTLASFIASVALTRTHPSWSYFGLHTRAWELGVGATLACIVQHTDRIAASLRAVLGWVGLVGIAGSVITFGEVAAFPGYAAALPVLATGLVLIAGDTTSKSVGVVLRQPPLQYLGSRSYSLYLWHWPVLIIAEAHLLRSLTFSEQLVAAATILCLSEAGFRVIEQPIRTSRKLARRPTLSLTIGAVLVTLGVTTSAVVASYEPDLTTGVEAATPTIVSTTVAPSTTESASAAATTTTLPSPPIPVTNVGEPALPAIVDALAATVLPDNLRPSLSSAYYDAPLIYGDGCHQYYASGVKPDCVFGDPASEITVALWGDSHAAQWFTPLAAIAAARGWRLLPLTQGGCAYIDVVTLDVSSNAERWNCRVWREAVREYMREQDVDVVLLSQHYGLRTAGKKRAVDSEDWQNYLPDLIDSLRADGIEPMVISDSPDPSSDVPDCVARYIHSVNRCAPYMYNNEDLAAIEAVRAITTGAGVSFVEPGEWLCTDDALCPPIVGDILVYRDGHHLTDAITAWLAPLVDSSIGQFIDDLVEYRRSSS